VNLCCRLILFQVAHPIAPSGLPVELHALGAGHARPIVDKLRRLGLYRVRWNSDGRGELAVVIVNLEIRWNSCPARNPLTFFLFLNFYLDSIFSLTTKNTGRFRWNSGGIRWKSGGQSGHALTPFPLPVPCTTLLDCRSVHRTSGGNGPRRHRLFECRDCADNQFHRNSLAVHLRYHFRNRGVQADIPNEFM
jgi:hypothetical protein